MRRRTAWFLGAAVAALGATLAIGQQLTPSGLSGNETWQVGTGGPGGTSIFVTANHMRNTQSYQLTSQATGAITATPNVVEYIFTAALSGAVTLTAPATPYDGQRLLVTNGTGAAFTQTITLTAATGQTVVNGACATEAVGASCAWIYTATGTTWYRNQ